MFQPSSSRDPLLTRGGDSDSDGGESVEKHAYNHDSNIGGLAYFTDVDEDQSLTPISESTIVEGVDANILKLPREDQRFIFVEFSPDWSLVVTVTSDETFSVWDATNRWVLVGSKRLRHDGRILKCIAFDPYVEEAVLLCFDSGEIFRTNLRGPATSDDPGSSQEQGMNYVELVHKCEGRNESRFDYFTFSSDRTTMVYYNFDGELAAVRFQRQDEPKWTSLSKEFVLKQDPRIYVSEKSTLITSVMKSSEDRESMSEGIETLFWSRLGFEDSEALNTPVNLEGKGYLSDDAKYVVIFALVTQHQSTCCQLDVYLTEGFKSNMNVKRTPLTSRTLTFTSSYPHLEFLDRDQFNFLNLEHKQTEPLIAIHQTNSVGNRLLLWDTYSDAFVYEVDLTLNKEAREFSEVQYCWSSDYKWLGVCSIGARMMGLVCARSGVFVWTTDVPQISRKDSGFCTMLFNRSGTRLMIHLGKMVFLFEPSCLSKKPQKHPMRDNLLLSQDFQRYSDFEILELAKEWPKQVLFSVFLACQRDEKAIQYFLLDVAVSLSSKRLVLICRKYEGQQMVFVIDYNETSSWESLWMVVASRWNQCCLSTDTVPLLKEIKKDQRRKSLSVFYYGNEESGLEQIALLSSERYIEMQVFDSEMKQLSNWTRLSKETCASFRQSKDRRRIISLGDRRVFIIELTEKKIVKRVEYSFGLSQWWDVFLDRLWLFAYSQYDDFSGQECDKRHILFLQNRLRGLFDVADDGETILIGWDNERKRSLVITPDKSEDQFRTEWDEAHESLVKCSMLTENGKWLGFIDYQMLRGGDIVVCVANTTSKCHQRIWLGADKSLVKSFPSLSACFFLQVDEAKEKLITLELEEIGPLNKLKQFSIGLFHYTAHVQDHQTLLETMIRSTSIDQYGKRNQPFTFNMRTDGMSNFQRILIEEGEEMMKTIANYAFESKVKVSDMYLSCYDNKHDCTTILTHALETKNASLVKLCLGFIENGIFPFHSASAMVKASFFDLLFSYKELFVPILKKTSFMLRVAEVKVPSQVFYSPNVVSNVVFTSNTILEPNEQFIEAATEGISNLESNVNSSWTKNHREGMMILSLVSVHCIANACKVGLDGIIRRLLMVDTPPAIFKTELIRATIYWKWERLWKRRCLHELRLYVLFLVLFTSYAIGIGLCGERLVHDKYARLALSFLLLEVVLLVIAFLFGECMQLKTYIEDGKEVFKTHVWGVKHYFWKSKWNLVDLSSYLLVLIIIPVLHCRYMFGKSSKKPLFAVIAIESLLAWFKVWYFAQPFKQTSALVLLISNVVYDCLPFLFLALIILIGFSVALYVLFQCCPPPSRLIGYTEANEIIKAISLLSKATRGSYKEERVTEAIKVIETRDELAEIEENEVESFGSPWRSLSTMFYAMLGEFKPEVYYNHQCMPWLTTFVFILYMALEMIVMLNMLIAIMGDTFDRVKNEEDVQIIIGRASFIDACEASLTTRQIKDIDKQIGKFLYVLTPKDHKHATKQKNWKGKINVIEENVKTTIKALETNVMKAIKENQNAINDNKEEMENNMQERFNQMESMLQKALEEHKHMLEEYKASVEQHTK